jgi:putative transposase
MEAMFCVDCLEDAMRKHGNPEVFNSDQGTQFTSEAFIGVLKHEGVTISMDGRGRAFDNIFVERLWRSIKHGDVYLNGYATMGDLLVELSKYFIFYNDELPHQALKNQAPDGVHKTATGGGAMILEKYCAINRHPIALRSTEIAQDEVGLEKSAIPNAKNRGSAVQLCVKSSAT